ncbi:MAG: competence/damage-inducible protein A [Gemmatimonadota bacterium]
MTPRAAIVAVGDELLFGETVDTNSAWLGREMTGLGVLVTRCYTIADSVEEIQDAVAAAARVADLVLITGGLGPTRDDLTRDAVADLYGRPLREDPDLLSALEARFAARGYDRLPEPNRTQACVPEGARVLTNRHGTAPGLALEERGVLVVLLPGVPREMRGIVGEELLPLLRERYADRLASIRHRVLRTAGVAESRLSELVDDALPADLGPVSIAFLPDALGVDLRLTVRGSAGADAAASLDQVEALLAPVVEPWRFEADSGDLAEAVIDALRSRGATLGVGESCTGGLLGYRITRIAGVSDVLLGGVVAYANAAKQDLLGVPEEEIERHGAVSEEVARRLAEGARRVFGADVGIGITGIAGPGGGSAEKPVGTVWTAVAFEDDLVTSHSLFSGDREGIQVRAAQHALRLLHDRLRATVGDP